MRLRYATTWAQEKIIRLVVPVCLRWPFTSSHRSSFWGSGTSSLVTSHGPTGPKVSKPLPLPHWPPLRWSCQSRADTSLAST